VAILRAVVCGCVGIMPGQHGRVPAAAALSAREGPAQANQQRACEHALGAGWAIHRPRLFFGWILVNHQHDRILCIARDHNLRAGQEAARLIQIIFLFAPRLVNPLPACTLCPLLQPFPAGALHAIPH
jgi:hypothetical protein